MISGVVEAINLSDENDAVNTIWVATTNKGRNLIKASPLNMNVRYIPVLGEMVYLVKAATDESSGTRNSEKYYYVSPVAVHRNINHNAIPPFLEMEGTGAGIGYATISAGATNASSPSTDIDLGRGFVEMDSLPQLQGFLGDIIFEGRFGQSIRFGYTPTGVTIGDNRISAVKQQPSWSSPIPESPITIIRNGINNSVGYNKLVVEDINKDASSIWLTDQQTINLTLSNKTALGITPVSTYKSPQVILNSERVIINSKKDSVIISGKKSVNISTPNWKADMNKMFNQIDAINKELTNLNIQVTTLVATISTALPPAAIPLAPITTQLGTIGGNLSKITSELQLMKQ